MGPGQRPRRDTTARQSTCDVRGTGNRELHTVDICLCVSPSTGLHDDYRRLPIAKQFRADTSIRPDAPRSIELPSWIVELSCLTRGIPRVDLLAAVQHCQLSDRFTVAGYRLLLDDSSLHMSHQFGVLPLTRIARLEFAAQETGHRVFRRTSQVIVFQHEEVMVG